MWLSWGVGRSASRGQAVTSVPAKAGLPLILRFPRAPSSLGRLLAGERLLLAVGQIRGFQHLLGSPRGCSQQSKGSAGRRDGDLVISPHDLGGDIPSPFCLLFVSNDSLGPVYTRGEGVSPGVGSQGAEPESHRLFSFRGRRTCPTVTDGRALNTSRAHQVPELVLIIPSSALKSALV